MLMALCCVDVLGGFTITIRTAQRDISMDRPEQMVWRLTEGLATSTP